MARSKSKTLLQREDWISAALQALADDGLVGVAVESLATDLGTTKGSFYWHFKNRDELIVEALAAWEQKDTDNTIDELEAIKDPVERLRIATAWATSYEEAESPDVRLLPAGSNPLIGEVVRRVQRKRLKFLAQTFREAGFTADESRLRARLAYSLSLGWHLQQLAEGSSPTDRKAYQRLAVEVLMTPSRSEHADRGRHTRT